MSLTLTNAEPPLATLLPHGVCFSVQFGKAREENMARYGHNRACDHVARNVQNICSILAIGFFIFGISLAAIVSGSLEVRGSYFLIYGCTPALSCYVSGHILRHSLNLTWKLCELAAPRIGRGLLFLAIGFWNWKPIKTRRLAGGLLVQDAYSSTTSEFVRTYRASLEWCCTLIRASAQLIIGIRSRTHRSDDSVSYYQPKIIRR